jgi:sarcosine oxidase subunit beta
VRADYVVVGGGVVGCGVAWHLARRGAGVVVLEANEIAAGASGGEGERGVRANGRDPRELPLMADAYDAWARLGAALGAPAPYRRIGHLQLIEREPDLHAAAAAVERQRRHGIPTDLLERDALLRVEPGVSDAVLAAVHCPLDGVADHTAVTRATAQAAARCGARIVEHARVVELRARRGRIECAMTTAERVMIDRGVVVACNAGTAPLFTTAGVALPVFTVLPQVLLTAPVAPGSLRHLIGHADRSLALKQLPDRRVMITGGRLGRWDPAGARGVVVQAEVDANLADAVAVFPCLAGVDIELAVADREETVAQDMIPIVDRVPGTDNALVATAWSGHGWAIAPVVAALLADWLLTGTRPDALTPFALARFGAADGV